MFRLLLTSLTLIITFASCLNKKKYLSEPIKTPQDNGYSMADSPSGYCYKSGFFVWNKTNKKYDYVPGKWVKNKPGYYWDAGEWQKSKYGYKYSKARYRKSPKEKAKPA
jgi:hypothetical protein